MNLKSVGVIGGGITGLTAGFYLKRRGIPVTVYEAGVRAGGVIESRRQMDYLAECGPNTILETSPKIAQLVLDAGLKSRRFYSDPKAEARYLVRGGQPVAMPRSPLGFFTTRLFGARAKLAVLREPFVRRRTDGKEESVAEFVKRRLNDEFLDRAIDALVAGVYAGDPYRLSLPQAFPRLAELEMRYGSLVKGQILGARERKRRGEIARDRAPKFSFDAGLQALPDTLAAHLGSDLKLETAVTRLVRRADGWSLDLTAKNGAASTEHGAVVYCGTAYGLAALNIDIQSGDPLTVHGTPAKIDLSPFSEIRYPPVASVVLGFRREDVAHPCHGFGMLVPGIEGFKILGTIFSSSLFPGRAPAGHVTLSSYLGGERQPKLASLPEDELIGLTCKDLRILLGVRGSPTFVQCVVYPRAIPQYNLGYGRYRNLLSDIEHRLPGLFFAGHYRDGVSLGDSILSGCNAVERVGRFVTTK